MSETNYDFEFETVRRVGHSEHELHIENRLVVASEEEWQELVFECHHEKQGCPPLKILLNCETLFSGDDGPIVTIDGRHPAVGHPSGKWYYPDQSIHEDVVAIELSDIQTRLFQTIEGSQAEIDIWVGESIDGFLDLFFHEVDTYPAECFENARIGTTESNKSKLESIRHLCAGVYLK